MFHRDPVKCQLVHRSSRKVAKVDTAPMKLRKERNRGRLQVTKQRKSHEQQALALKVAHAAARKREGGTASLT